MNIRVATLKELDAVVGFQMAMALETEGLVLEEPVLRKGVEAALRDSNKGVIYVAETSEKVIVGSLMITFEWSDWRNGWIWWIESLYVVPPCRKKGVFNQLYEHIRELVQADEQVKGIRLYVDKRNARAQKVYEAIGMCGEHYTTYEWMK